MKPEYKSTSVQQSLAHVIEECGEVIAAAGKSLRWGLSSVNPELPLEQQESNRDWLFREITDLEQAILYLKSYIAYEEVQNNIKNGI